MKGSFTRVHPGESTEALSIGWFGVSHHWMDEKQNRRDAYGTLYKITSSNGTVYRTLKFAPRLKGSPKKESGQILIDWHAWITLSKTGSERNAETLKIKKANTFEIFWHSMSHPDPAYRHSMAVARMGLYISLISVILAFK